MITAASKKLLAALLYDSAHRRVDNDIDMKYNIYIIVNRGGMCDGQYRPITEAIRPRRQHHYDQGCGGCWDLTGDAVQAVQSWHNTAAFRYGTVLPMNIIQLRF